MDEHWQTAPPDLVERGRREAPVRDLVRKSPGGEIGLIIEVFFG
jgi:hypothetical protein